VPFAQPIRHKADMPTVEAGLITDPRQAEGYLSEGRCDLIALRANVEPELAPAGSTKRRMLAAASDFAAMAMMAKRSPRADAGKEAIGGCPAGDRRLFRAVIATNGCVTGRFETLRILQIFFEW
jgi:hypothetical protein